MTDDLTLRDAHTVPTAYWHELDDGRIQCDVCPRACKLREGQRGVCFVRGRVDDQVVLTTYGRSSGYCLDPIEKKPLNHFLPGSAVLSFGTAGCNLACRFCQNWDISKSKEIARLSDSASPDAIADAAVELGAQSVAFTYNDPVVFLEYAADTADACRDRGIRAVVVSAGYMCDEPRRELYRHVDAANIDLKAFSQDFYRHVAMADLDPVLDTLVYLRHETDVWFEITTLLIPDHNDGDDELHAMTEWIVEHLGVDVPLHFTAFHPDFKMLDVARTPPATLRRARAIARSKGLQFVYTGNVHDTDGGSTYCPNCQQVVVERDWYELGAYRLTDAGACLNCGVSHTRTVRWAGGHVGRSSSRGDVARTPMNPTRGSRNTRPPAVAGTFYPRQRDALEAMVGDLLNAAPPPPRHLPSAKAIVAPHAGYLYSGPIAATAYRAIEARRHDIERVVLIGPSHRVALDGLALPSVSAFSTPLGDVAIDDAARRRATNLAGVVIDDRPHADEHSLEVHMPFLQHVLDDGWSLVPILVGRAEAIPVADVLAALWGGRETVVVVSTDLSHYHDYATAAELDRHTADAIVREDVDAVESADACGAAPVRGLLELSRRAGLQIELLDLRSSGDTGGDRQKVVGYGAFAVA